jgi:hypothetical protein
MDNRPQPIDDAALAAKARALSYLGYAVWTQRITLINLVRSAGAQAGSDWQCSAWIRREPLII